MTQGFRYSTLAAVCCLATTAQAQLAPSVDGVSNTLVILERPQSGVSLTPAPLPAPVSTGLNSLSAGANINAEINQTTTGVTQASEQSLSVSGAQGNNRGGSARLQGDVRGRIDQTNSATTQRSQKVEAGSLVNGNVSNLRTEGVINANITQSATGSGSLGAQSIGVGSVSSSTLSTATTRGSLTGIVTQSVSDGALRGDASQRIDAGGIADSRVSNATTRGTISSEITQTRAGGVGEQSIGVGSIRGVNGGGVVNTSGTLSGRVNQSASTNISQRVEVGSVVGGTPANAVTDARVSADITQSSSGIGGTDTRQTVEAGVISGATGTADTAASISGRVNQINQGSSSLQQNVQVGGATGTAGSVLTTGSLSGTVTQSAAAATGAVQNLSVGSAIGTSGRTETFGAVFGNVNQNVLGGSNNKQVISVGNAEGTSGDVGTRALVTGTLNQNASNAFNGQQSINLGSVKNVSTGSVRTDVTLSGNITQSQTGGGGKQNVLVGGVEGQ